MNISDLRPPAVLFVCLGNICRSPAAEGVMRQLVSARGLEESIEVDSAGTGDWHIGKRADPRMRAAAEQRGYRLDSIARQVTPADLERFDLVVAMDRENHQELVRLAGSLEAETTRRIHLLSSFLPTEDPVDVPDPYYGGASGFEVVLDLLEEACPRILDQLLASGFERHDA